MTVSETATATIPLRQFIAGKWEAGTGKPIVSKNPYDPGQVVAEGHQAQPADVERAMTAASDAARGWARTPMHERGAILLRAAELIEQQAEKLGMELTLEEGKTFAEGTGEVLRAAQIFRYCAQAADRLAGEIYNSPRKGERILVAHKPLGVVGVITPFNFPIAIPAWKIAPALVYGNTVVWKPASAVPLLAQRLTEALDEAGLPSGVLNLVIGSGTLGDTLLDDPRLDGLTFTGSTGVGRKLTSAAALRGIPMQAEMGGKNASIVFADADLDLAAEQVILGAFRSTGQKCTATSRLIVEEAVADDFLSRITKRLAQWRVGDPTDPAVHMGPVVSESAADAIRHGIDRAIEQGARIVSQRSEVESMARTFVSPTVLEIPSEPERAAMNTAWRDELFGPVLAVRRARNAVEAFRLANDSEFGLSAAVFTQSLNHTLDALDEVDVGILHVNSESAGADPHVPFGGVKKSGYGPMEQGSAAQQFFTHTTTVYLSAGALS